MKDLRILVHYSFTKDLGNFEFEKLNIGIEQNLDEEANPLDVSKNIFHDLKSQVHSLLNSSNPKLDTKRKSRRKKS